MEALTILEILKFIPNTIYHTLILSQNALISLCIFV